MGILLGVGALTKGDRRAATGADLGDFNFDTPYGRSSLRTMYDAICQVMMMKIMIISVCSICFRACNINNNFRSVFIEKHVQKLSHI